MTDDSAFLRLARELSPPGFRMCTYFLPAETSINFLLHNTYFKLYDYVRAVQTPHGTKLQVRQPRLNVTEAWSDSINRVKYAKKLACWISVYILTAKRNFENKVFGSIDYETTRRIVKEVHDMNLLEFFLFAPEINNTSSL